MIALCIFPAEAASPLTKAERQRLIPVGQARTLLADILTTPLVLHPYEPLLGRAVDISSQSRGGLYDCLYVARADREGCELVTDDQKLLNYPQPQFPFLAPLASLASLASLPKHSAKATDLDLHPPSQSGTVSGLVPALCRRRASVIGV